MKPTNFKSHRPLRPWDVHGLLFWIASAVALIPSVGVLAQLSGRGEISRRVSNQALDLFLEGARVDLVGTNRAVLTDRDGHAVQGRATGSRRSGRSIANVRSVRMRTPRRSSCLRPKPTRW